jgi:hypothetical protein
MCIITFAFNKINVLIIKSTITKRDQKNYFDSNYVINSIKTVSAKAGTQRPTAYKIEGKNLERR